MHPLDSAGLRAEIRAEMRTRRAEVSDDDQAAASMAVLTRLARTEIVRKARTVAGYRAVRGEVDIGASLAFLGEHGATITTPRLMGEHLEFVVTDESTPVTAGPFGIEEPTEGEIVPVHGHDVFLVPLVAFDRVGHRLGHGGGYYDRALASISGLALADRPALIGIAHAFQQVAEIPPEPWDVPLDAIVTEDAVIEVTPGTADRTT